jgi:hypothetical protein
MYAHCRFGWRHCDTNKRHILFDTHLLFDASHRDSGCQLYSVASQDLIVVLYLRKQHIEKQNIQKYIAKLLISIKPINYIYQSNIT